MATYPTVDLSSFTPQVADSISPEDIDEYVSTPTPDLAVETAQALRTYPLWVGSSWVYEYLGFDQEREVIWRVVETVVSTQFYQGHYAAEVARTIDLLEGFADTVFPTAPQEATFWLVLMEGNLYRADSLDHFNPDTAWLELVFPIPEATAGWYPDSALRALTVPSEEGLRTASAPFQQALPMGGTYTCYTVMTQDSEGLSKGTFCEGVGYVYREYTNTSLNYGYRSELTGFTLQ